MYIKFAIIRPFFNRNLVLSEFEFSWMVDSYGFVVALFAFLNKFLS